MKGAPRYDRSGDEPEKPRLAVKKKPVKTFISWEGVLNGTVCRVGDGMTVGCGAPEIRLDFHGSGLITAEVGAMSRDKSSGVIPTAKDISNVRKLVQKVAADLGYPAGRVVVSSRIRCR